MNLQQFCDSIHKSRSTVYRDLAAAGHSPDDLHEKGKKALSDAGIRILCDIYNITDRAKYATQKRVTKVSHDTQPCDSGTENDTVSDTENVSESVSESVPDVPPCDTDSVPSAEHYEAIIELLNQRIADKDEMINQLKHDLEKAEDQHKADAIQIAEYSKHFYLLATNADDQTGDDHDHTHDIVSDDTVPVQKHDTEQKENVSADATDNDTKNDTVSAPVKQKTVSWFKRLFSK